MNEYDAFLRAKTVTAPSLGFEVDPSEVNPILKPHQRDIVTWAVSRGRAALFESFGLGKTMQQLETMRLTLTRAGGRGLIVLPLGVRQEFMRDAGILGIEVRFIRTIEEAGETGIYLTNYETVRDGKLDPREFTVVSLDEAGVLRGFGGTKTFREFMAIMAGDDRRDRSNHLRVAEIPYRFVATATPSPNEFIELLAYSAFLGVMDVSAAKTRFFKRNSEKADALTLHPHKEEEFWHWVASWAVFVQKPSDLGYSDEGYSLPPLDVRWHEVPSDHTKAGVRSDGQGRMVANAALGVVEASREKRLSLDARIAKLMEIRAEEPESHRIIWHDLEDERRAIEDQLPVARYDHWEEFRDGQSDALALYERHYSARQYQDGRERTIFVGPGEKTVLLTPERDALFVWRKFRDDSGQEGVNCAVFRNEGHRQSSELITEAMTIAWLRWPDKRLYTYVNPDEIQSRNPGYCFQVAGWRKCGTTKGGLVILEAFPGVGNPYPIERRAGMASVYGAQDLEEREAIIRAFADGELQEIAAKPVMLGSGVNFQRHCSRAVYLGIGFKFNDFIQSVHRLQRFLQTEPVRIDLIYTEAEREVRAALERKWRQHNELVANMTGIIREFGLANVNHADGRTLGVERQEERGDNWTLVNNDSVLETAQMEADSVDLIVTSIPFSTQYEYSPSYNDFGHTDDEAHFWRQMDFLTPNLLRVLKPGRNLIIHCKDRVAPGGLTGLGFQTVQPFHAAGIYHYQKHGFAYLGMKTVVTDVVRENNQTYRLGWTEQCKDGTRMGVGMPEYLLIFRKPPTDSSDGYADTPVVKDKSQYSRARWQTDAHGFMRSSGDRLLTHAEIYQKYRELSLTTVYDYEEHVALGEHLEEEKRLPVTFQLLPPQSWHPDVWTDVTRMRTLNAQQYAKGKEMHLCPLQFDIVDRVITQMSMPGELVFDPFSGLGTVPLRAVKLGRKGLGCELSPSYHADAVFWLRSADNKAKTMSLFDFIPEAV